MTHSLTSDEREERLAGIRNRFGTSPATWEDIGFLLSLLDSQTADRRERREPYSEECRAAIDELERRFESEEVELCSVEFARRLEQHTAAAMRTAYVEKVKEYFRYFPCTCMNRPALEPHFATCAVTIHDQLIVALQSLQVEQEKQ